MINTKCWHERGTKKNPESPTGLEPTTSQIPVGFIHRGANLPSFIYTFPLFERRFSYQSNMIYNIVRNVGEILYVVALMTT